MIEVSRTLEAVLDLIPPAHLCAAIKYQCELDDGAEDWEPRHVHAAQQLCEYAKLTHPGCRAQADKLLDRLDKLGVL